MENDWNYMAYTSHSKTSENWRIYSATEKWESQSPIILCSWNMSCQTYLTTVLFFLIIYINHWQNKKSVFQTHFRRRYLKIVVLQTGWLAETSMDFSHPAVEILIQCSTVSLVGTQHLYFKTKGKEKRNQ